MQTNELPTTYERLISKLTPPEMDCLPDPRTTRDRLALVLTDRNIHPALRGSIAAGLIASELAYSGGAA